MCASHLSFRFFLGFFFQPQSCRFDRSVTGHLLNALVRDCWLAWFCSAISHHTAFPSACFPIVTENGFHLLRARNMCVKTVRTTVRPVGATTESDRFCRVGASERRSALQLACQMFAARRSICRSSKPMTTQRAVVSF